MASDLKDTVALVTGGTRGIGLAIADLLADRGARLVVNGRTSDAEVEAALAALRKKTDVLFVPGDAADPAVAEKLAAETKKKFLRLDFLVPAAGGPHPGRILDLKPEDWEEAFRIHVHAVFHLFRAAHPLLAVRGGGVLLIGSVAGKRGVPGTIAYQVVKGALPQMARALARDHASEDIRVNVVEPGIIRTRFHAGMTPEAERNALENRIPLRRFGTPENVATVALELLTNPFITGETLTIDGGTTMRIA
jgi:NAD(P)-dependent dehydrogenase (short-subunit alcohol dehydrogenase family)